MNTLKWPVLVLGALLPGVLASAEPAALKRPPNTWVKLSPLSGGPVSPGLAYEASLVYDPQQRKAETGFGKRQTPHRGL